MNTLLNTSIVATVIIISLIGVGSIYLLSAIRKHDDILKLEKEEK